MIRTLAPWALAILLSVVCLGDSIAATTPVNINTADAATLAREMEGIGEAKARAIVEHRQKNGAFRSVDELALVKGIGAKTLENNRSRLTVGSGAARPPAPRASAGTSAPRPVTPRKPAENSR